MAAIESKGHVSIDGYIFMLAKQPRVERHVYGREEAPSFVNKFSSGDPNYRDSTFYAHWVQNNWLNGFDQEKVNDGGKYYRSSAVDPTDQEKLKLQKKFSTTGNLASSINAKVLDAWRASATSAFGDGSDGALTISVNTTDTPIDAACTGTSGSITLSATNASFAAGQVVLIHQTQGSGAGTYQKNKISSYSAGTITLETPLNATYATGAQVIVMKQYTTITVNTAVTWTAKAWDGTVGGILAVMANGVVTVTGTISANGKGYRGGDGAVHPTTAGNQGEGTSGAGSQSSSANGNGGGGGTSNNGGAGGGNGAAGTSGSVAAGGAAAGVAALTTMVFGGAGGGGGNSNNGGDDAGDGGAGGGIIFLFVKTPTVTGGITSTGSNGSNAATGQASGGGGGAGGSILIKGSTVVLGSTLVTAAGGSGGSGLGSGVSGAAGAVGRIHVDYSTSVSGTTTPTLDSTQDSSLTDTPAGSNFTLISAGSNGKIYSWDGADTYTELFDCRRLKWFDTIAGGDTDYVIGDDAGTERAQAQGFQLDAATKVKAVQVYIKKADGTPNSLVVRIETSSSNNPTGTLADANLTKTILVTDVASSFGWITVEFDSASSVALSASTTYHVVLKTAAAGNDNNYEWKADASSPSFTSGARSHSADGGTVWTADTAADFLFRILGETTEVNCDLVTSVTGTKKMYFGTGTPTGTTNGNARLYSYDGTSFALVKTFNTSNEFAVMSLCEFGATTNTVYIGLGGGAKIYSTTDFSTFTLKKTITSPAAGYVYSLKEYNQRLYATGGFPEQLNNNNSQYSGFLYSWDEFTWQKVGEFEHTVIVSLEVYDNLLFLGSIKRDFYVYNTASVDKLFELPYDMQITAMRKWNDMLALALAPTPGTAASGHEGIYLFDRNGLHNAFNASSRSWYSLCVFNNNLMGGNDNGDVYQTSANTYQASGTLQSSYFEASLPSIDKLNRSLILQYESLPTGCSILAEYKTDESDSSWTTMGTASTVGSVQAEFTLAVSFYAKKISIRFTLATSTPANTPTLKLWDLRYVLAPDFKYLWKMKLTCPDNIVWLDGTEPISTTTAAISSGQTTLALTDGTGFPTKGRAVVVDGSTEDEFTWTGRSSNTLTGVSGLTTHSSSGLTVKMTGKMMHKQILTLKQAKTFYTFVDFDELSYTVLFHSYQADGFVVNQTDGLENDVPITLLEA